jgi:hypothetical protein
VTVPREQSFRDFRAPQLLPATGLTQQQCHDMQGVVLHQFMEKTRDPAAAREVLDMLGLAFHLPSGDEPILASEPVELLWDHSNGLTSQPKRKNGAA